MLRAANPGDKNGCSPVSLVAVPKDRRHRRQGPRTPPGPRTRRAAAAGCRRRSRTREIIQMRTADLSMCALLLAAGGGWADLAHHRLPAQRPGRRRSRGRGRGVVRDVLCDRPEALERLGPLRHLQRRPLGVGGFVLDRHRAPPAGGPMAHRPGLARLARRGGAGHAGGPGTGRHSAHPALVRGGAPRHQAGRRRRAAAARPVRSARQGRVAEPALHAPAGEAPGHPARPVGGAKERATDRLEP